MSETVSSVGGILNVAIGALPSILALIKSSHAAQNPGAAPLTDADAFAALAFAVASSAAKDRAWLAAHPVEADRPAPPASDTGE